MARRLRFEVSAFRSAWDAQGNSLLEWVVSDVLASSFAEAAVLAMQQQRVQSAYNVLVEVCGDVRSTLPQTVFLDQWVGFFGCRLDDGVLQADSVYDERTPVWPVKVGRS